MEIMESIFLIFTGLIFAQNSLQIPLSPTITPTIKYKVNLSPPIQSAVATPLCPHKLDIVIAIDSSGSVQNVWNDIIDNAEILAANFLINPKYTRVGIIDFSAVSNVYTPLDAVSSGEGIYNTLETLRSRPQNGETWMELGLDRASELLKSATPYREDVKKVLVMYTDGKATSGDEVSLKALAKDLRSIKVEIIAVKVSQNVSESGIKTIGCKSENIFCMNKDPGSGENNLKDAVCGSSGNNAVSTTPTTVDTTATTAPQQPKTSPQQPTTSSQQTTQQVQQTTQPPQKQETTPPSDHKQTTEPPSGTLPPQQVESKCEIERDHALWLKNSKIQTLQEIFVPVCLPDGRYAQIQHHEGTEYFWCVDQETGEVINGTKSMGKEPVCPNSEVTENNVTRPKTKCEKERDSNMAQIHMLPDLFIPKCSYFDGLYLEVQSGGMTGGKWCVNRYSGETINGTYVKQGDGNPLCPEKTKCESEREEAVKANYRAADTPGFVAFFVPQCQPNGLYTQIQVHASTGFAWCVDSASGEEINGTRKTPTEGIPVCPGLVNPVCLLGKEVGPCRAAATRYFFNADSANCEKFTYGGCEGNANNFEDFTKCHSTCGMLTKCLIEQERLELSRPFSNVTFNVPVCDDEGLYVKVQNSFNGSSWCVNPNTGQVIEGTLVQDKEADCEKETIVEPPKELKCHEETGKLLSGSNKLTADAFVPRCTPDGYYQEIQEHKAIGKQWCVHKYTGIEINGTRKNFYEGKLVCPAHENIDCLLPKDPGPCMALFPRYHYDWQNKRCVRFNYGGCQGNSNNFALLKKCEESCKVSGDQKPSENTNSTTQEENITTTLPPTPPPTPPTTSTTPTTPTPIQETTVSSVLTTATPVVTTTQTISDTTTQVPYPEQEPVPRPENIDMHYPTNPCSVEKDFAEQRQIQVGESWIPLCDVSGNYQPIQRQEGENGTKWCVDIKSGHIIDGTEVKNDQADPDCSKVDGEAATATTTQQPPLPTTTTTASPNTTQGGEHLETPILIINKTEKECEKQRIVSLEKTNNFMSVGHFIPECDEQGNFKQIQSDGTGYRWCVDTLTGHLIEGTEVAPGQGEPDCTNGLHPPVLEIKNITDTNITLLPTPEPENPPEEADKFHPKESCSVELDFARMRNGANGGMMMIGGYEPECDENGDYKPMQGHGSTGFRWCVDTKTGHLIEGTKVGPRQPDLVCTKGDSGTTTTTVHPSARISTLRTTTTTVHPSVRRISTLGTTTTTVHPSVRRISTLGTTTTTVHPSVRRISTLGTTTTTVHPSVRRISTLETTTTTVHPSVRRISTLGTTPTTTTTATTIAPATTTTTSTTISPTTQTSTERSNNNNASSSAQTNSTSTESQNNGTLGKMNDNEKKELLELAKNCPFEIGVNLTKIGCYHDDQVAPRPLPLQLFDDKPINVEDPSSDKDWKEFIKGVVCKCAQETQNRGWFTFGIQNYGECFSGPDEGRYDEDRLANSDMCIDEDQTPCKKSDNQACAGIPTEDKEAEKTRLTNYIFMIKTETHTEIHRIEYDKKKRKRNIHGNKKHHHHSYTRHH